MRKNMWMYIAAIFLTASAVVATDTGCRTFTTYTMTGRVDPEALFWDVQGAIKIVQAWNWAQKSITPEEEYFIGRSVSAAVMSRYYYRFYNGQVLATGQLTPGMLYYLYEIGSVLDYAAQDTPIALDGFYPIAGFHFMIMDNAEINAFSAPGGYVFVTSGFLALASNEDEAAAILAHEMGHVLLRHGVRMIKKSRQSQFRKVVMQETVEAVSPVGMDLLQGVVSDITEAMVLAGYARSLEYQADEFAYKLLYYSGYNPVALYKVIEKLHRMGLEHVASRQGWFSTHPKPIDRMKKLWKYMSKAGRPKYRLPRIRMLRYRRHARPLYHQYRRYSEFALRYQ